LLSQQVAQLVQTVVTQAAFPEILATAVLEAYPTEGGAAIQPSRQVMLLCCSIHFISPFFHTPITIFCTSVSPSLYELRHGWLVPSGVTIVGASALHGGELGPKDKANADKYDTDTCAALVSPWKGRELLF